MLVVVVVVVMEQLAVQVAPAEVEMGQLIMEPQVQGQQIPEAVVVGQAVAQAVFQYLEAQAAPA
jgi:hypothetical protein